MNHVNLLLLGAWLPACTTPKAPAARVLESGDASTPIDDTPDDPLGGDTSEGAFDTAVATDTATNPADTGAHDADNGQSAGDTAETGEPWTDTEFGEISGDCGVLSLPGDSGRSIQNTIDFGTTAFNATLLSDGGAEIFRDGTLGGSSIHSEVMAFEVLHRCEEAILIKSETEIAYIDPAGKKTDMLVAIDGVRVGVSVTRAYKWGDDVVYTEDDAHSLLTDKLSDVLLSRANVDASDAWTQSMLYVMTHDASYLPSLTTAYARLSTDLTADTIVWFTVTNGDDEFVY